MPSTVQFLEMGEDSDMKTPPGIAQGIYMWTAGPYTVEPGEEFILSFIIQANSKGVGDILFRVTAANMYIEGPSISVRVD